jgi:hypothetical protein
VNWMRWLILVLFVVVLAGCSAEPADDTPADADSSESESPVADEESPTETADPTEPSLPNACEVLSDTQVAEVTGVAMGPGSKVESPLDTCLYDKGATRLQVISDDAAAWLEILPQANALAKEQGLLSAKQFANANQLLADVDPTKPCEAFPVFLKVQNVSGPANSDTVVSVVPSAEDPQYISAVGCVQDQYASVLYATKGLAGSKAERDRTYRALNQILDQKVG